MNVFVDSIAVKYHYLYISFYAKSSSFSVKQLAFIIIFCLYISHSATSSKSNLGVLDDAPRDYTTSSSLAEPLLTLFTSSSSKEEPSCS